MLTESVQVISESTTGFKQVKITIRPEKWISVVVDATFKPRRFEGDEVDTIESFRVDSLKVLVDPKGVAKQAEMELDYFLCEAEGGTLPGIQRVVAHEELQS